MKRFTIDNLNLLTALRQRLNSIEVRNPKMAQLLCQLIPSHCPFERTIKFFNFTLVHIPPLCKLNPLYEQLVELRFKALSYLVDRGDLAGTYI
jgi:hypothetical protein